MPLHPLETLRHELPAALARRSDLAELEAQADAVLAAAGEQRGQLARQLERARQDLPDWIINLGGAATTGGALGKMILVGKIALGDLVLSGGGSILTLWGVSRFWRKIGAERDLRRRMDHLTERVQNLDQARRRIRRARRLRGEL